MSVAAWNRSTEMSPALSIRARISRHSRRRGARVERRATLRLSCRKMTG
jgi:hypothetical protein